MGNDDRARPGAGLTKSYGRHRGVLQVSFNLAAGVRVPGSQWRRQDVAVRLMVQPVAVGTVPGYVSFGILGLVLSVLPWMRRDLGGVACWAIHVCICDPGVGTVRRSLAILTDRGDVLIGPDNGVLLPAVVTLGGAVEARAISNPAVKRHPISAVFHGRDVFCPAAAQLANDLSFELVGEPVDPATLAPAPFTDAAREQGRWIARVIHVDKFGNAHLNIARDEWPSLAPPDGGPVDVLLRGGRRVAVAYHATFGDVRPGAPVMLAENDGRPVLAVRGSLAATCEVALRDDVVVETPRAVKACL